MLSPLPSYELNGKHYTGCYQVVIESLIFLRELEDTCFLFSFVFFIVWDVLIKLLIQESYQQTYSDTLT